MIQAKPARPAGRRCGGVDGNRLKIDIAQTQKAVVGGHVRMLAAGNHCDPQCVLDSVNAFGKGLGGHGKVVKMQHFRRPTTGWSP